MELLEPLQLTGCTKSIRAIHDVMDLIGGKWKISIIASLCFHPSRFSDLLRQIDGISGKVLSRDLKELEVNGLISRKVLDTQPISVEYTITEYGATLKELTAVISDWGLAHRRRIIDGLK
ncbi:helix-turn-helix domain-containing protein [Flavobacterium sp.]|uniref:winged helix-turn-helix transcriptional regulator n=1 Tax=Flavobacterium sp. TaxID=239 RepID=UPI001225614B|nr:helix-turn-helix domain-containing protein [Flavobacterium sp.]RZJ72235.1 MAG: transcriptional regulator [Flavobacterium sp.]